ncbi:MAG: SDR family oxidoreductase [Gemmatimonadaceae bacterium]|nr:SDR family oxidoreductase [Gemmatimonadaceae bacterium]
MTGASTGAFLLTGRVAAVTGAGSGIGRAIAAEFVRAGAHVYCLDRDVAAVTAVAAAHGGAATAMACDVTDVNSVQRAFETIAGSHSLDILVNNAGVSHIGNVGSTAPEDFERLFRVNVQGVYLCTRAAIGGMASRGRGVIVNMASIAASAGLADRFAYSMTKGAVVAMTYSIARDYVSHGVRCNCISPARVHTPFVDNFLAASYPGREGEVFARLSAAQPVGRMGTPEEVATLARFLASDEAAFITGSDYPLDGGFLRLHG